MKAKLKKALIRFNMHSVPERIILILFFLFFVFEALVVLIPFLTVVMNSVKTSDEILSAPMALPQAPRFKNFVDIFSYPDGFYVKGTVGYGLMFLNSLWQTGVYLLVNLASSSFVAYTLAKYRFPGRSIVYFVLIFTQTIPIVGTGAAMFKHMVALNMYNNPALIWFAWAGGFDYSAFVMFGFFSGISISYMEAASIDGASEWQIYTKIMLPQMMPCIVALMVTNFVGKWNDYSTSQIYLNNYPTLAYGLFLYQQKSNFGDSSKLGMYYAALIITALPGIVLYSSMQNFIIKNMTVGGLKG